MAKRTKASGFSAEIRGILNGYSTDCNEALQQALKDVSKQALKTVKAKSPKRYGTYQKGWAVTKTENGFTVHNKKEYRRTHLLENGHQLPQGGRAKAYPHIGPTEQEVQRVLPLKAKQAIEEATGS